MSKINDNLKNAASKIIFDNKLVDTIRNEMKKLDVYVNIFGQLKIVGVNLGSIEEDIKTIKNATEHMLTELQKIQEKTIEENK